MKNSKFYEYDKRGVRAFVTYASGNGKWLIECYRKKTAKEIKDDFDKLKTPPDSNWKMIRVGSVSSYNTRQEAEQKALELAEEICSEFGF